MIVYRVFRHENKLFVKLVHFGLQLVVFAIAVWGLKAVFDFHNHNNIPNLYSLHSWCGLITVILFSSQVSHNEGQERHIITSRGRWARETEPILSPGRNINL